MNNTKIIQTIESFDNIKEKLVNYHDLRKT